MRRRKVSTLQEATRRKTLKFIVVRLFSPASLRLQNGNYTTPAVSRETFTYGNTTRTRDYTTDEYGRVTKVVDSVLGTNEYTYDYRGYLTEENTTEYEYDHNGNMTKKNGYFVTYDSTVKDILSKINGDNVYYSSQNPLNPSSCGDLTFEFEGRRLTYCGDLDFDAEYIYNNEGLRTKKIVYDTTTNASTTVNYAYEGTKLVCEYTTSKRMDYLYDGNGILYGLIYNGNKYFYLRDHLANILGIIDSSGNLVVSYDYSAYGNLKSITGSMATTLGKDNHMRYKGYYFDEETGFYYCKSRYYVPEWCRWLNADSPSFLKPYSATGNNLFAYCSNDPVNKIDDTGCFAISLSALFATVAIGAILGGIISYYSSQKSGDTKKEKLFKILSGAALGGMYGLSTGLGAMLVTGGTIAGLSAGASFAAGLGVSLGGSALLGAANSFINQTIDNDWDLNAIDGNVIAYDSIVATIKGAVSFVSGAWTGAAGLWNIPEGAAPGALNLITKTYLNVTLGALWRLSIDLVYSGIKKR